MAWFLSFLWKRPTDDRWHPVEATTDDEHPIAYMNRARRAYDEGHEFRLLFFTEILPELVARPDTPRTTAGAIPRQPLNVR